MTAQYLDKIIAVNSISAIALLLIACQRKLFKKKSYISGKGEIKLKNIYLINNYKPQGI